MRIKVMLECPYCNLFFETQVIWPEIKNNDFHFPTDGIMQICPDDQFEGACGNVFYFDFNIIAQPTRYFSAPDVIQSLQASADKRGVPPRPEPHTTEIKKR